MKRIIFLLSVFVLFTFGTHTLFANSDTFFQIQYLVDENLEGNAAEIYDLAATLSFNERMMVFDQNKENPLMPFLINWFLGFGVGSYLQGDSFGGTFGLLGDLAFVGLYAGGFYVFNVTYDLVLGGVLLGGAVVVGLTSRIFQLVRPWLFTNTRNTFLKQALGLLPYGSLRIAPVVGRVATLDGFENTYGARFGLLF